MTAEEARVHEKEATGETVAAIKFAENSPAPTVEEILQDVYCEVDEDSEAGNTGRHFFND
jgi:pyruvate dehydrogenase E1 component alpha subunit